MNRNLLPDRTVCALAILAIHLAAGAATVQAQTWVGPGTNWNTASNWSPAIIPDSAAAIVNFTGNAIGTVNISSSVFSQSLNFSNSTGGYTLTSDPSVVLRGLTAINVAANVTGTQTINLANIGSGSLVFPSGSNLTITNNSTAPGTTLLIGPSTVIGTSGSGGVFVNGPGNTTISGGFATGQQVFGGLHKNGIGTLTLSNFVNNYDGNTFVNGGTLQLGAGTAIPTGSNVSVAIGAQFNIGSLSNSGATAINTLALNGGTFRVPSGAGDYHLKQLAMSGSSTLDFTGTSNFILHFANGGTGITAIGGNHTWIGSGSSRILNETGAVLPINVAAGSALNLGVILASGGGQYRVSGGGFVTLTNTGNTGSIINDGFVITNDLSTNVGAGAFGTLGTGAFTNNLNLSYTGGTATSAKSITLGGSLPLIQVLSPGANLTMNGTLSGGGGLYAVGSSTSANPSTLTLTAANNYAGNTQVNSHGILAIPTIADAGTVSPIGTGGAVFLGGGTNSRGTLMLTGTNLNYSTNRSVTVGGTFTSSSGGAIGVQNAATTLTMSGQITSSGSLIKTGPGTLVLSGTINNHTGGTYVEAGTLRLGAGTAIPFLTNVTVASGAEFSTGGFISGGGNTIGTVTLNGGTFSHPSAINSSYFVNKLVMNGGVVSGVGSSTQTGVTFNQTGASIAVNSNSSWTGPTSFWIANSTDAELPITIAPNVTLTSSVSLARFFPNDRFRITGGGTFYRTTPTIFYAPITVSNARLMVDSFAGIGPSVFDVTLDAGTLVHNGAPEASNASFRLGAGGGTVEIVNAAATATLTGAITGAGPFTKSGPGTLSLMNTANQFSSVLVSAGRLEVSNDNQLGQANPTVNALGTLRYTASATTARTFNLNNGTLELPSGVALALNGATVAGGFLRGAGFYHLTGGTSLVGVTTFNSSTMIVIGPTSIDNFAGNGTLIVNAGQTLAMNYATNGAPGLMTISGTANVSDYSSYGRLSINPGGTVNNLQGTMAFAGGSVTNIGLYNPANGQVTPGGTLNIGPGGLRVQGGFVRNNGVITGTGNLIIDYLGLVRGAGEIDLPNAPIRINGGQLLAGNSPGLTRVSNFSLVSTGVTGGDFSNATGIAGPPIGSTGTQLSGWSVFEFGNSTNDGGSAQVQGTPASRAIWQFQTVLDSGNYSTPGVPANFNHMQSYVWQIVRPRSAADVGNPTNTIPTNTVAQISILDTATMTTVALTNANLNAYLRFDDTLWNWGTVPINERGTFGFMLLADGLGMPNRVIGVTYTPVPEPVAILAVAGLGLAIGHRVRKRRSLAGGTP